MKHVLIVNNNMHIGGVQKALVNLLHEIHGDYEVTLLLFYAGGELCVEIPEDVQVITARSPFRYWGMTRHDAVGLKDRLARPPAGAGGRAASGVSAAKEAGRL